MTGLGVLITVVIGCRRFAPWADIRWRRICAKAVESRGGGGGRTLQVIVAGQIAVTVMLLVGAALFGRSL